MKYLMTMFLLGALAAAAPANEPAVKTESKEAPALTPESLETMLVDLAYEPKDVSDKKNKEFLTIATDRNNWKINITLSLSSDRTALWFELYAVQVSDPEADLGDAWFKLLRHNATITPAYFTFNAKTKRLYLMMTVDNIGITAEKLRTLIDQFDGYVRSTANDWNARNFRAAPVAPPMSPEAQAMAAKLDGTWEVVEEESKGTKSDPAAVKAAEITFTFNKGKVVMKTAQGAHIDATVWILPTANPMQFDLYFPANKAIERGIAKLEGDTLTICTAYHGVDRPAEFKTNPEFKGMVRVLKRKVK